MRWASGVKSPEAPTDPLAGMQGSRSASISAISASTSPRETPEWPRPKAASLSTMTSRTTGSGNKGPLPTEWESTSRRCSSARSSASMAWLAKGPNPVLRP